MRFSSLADSGAMTSGLGMVTVSKGAGNASVIQSV